MIDIKVNRLFLGFIILLSVFSLLFLSSCNENIGGEATREPEGLGNSNEEELMDDSSGIISSISSSNKKVLTASEIDLFSVKSDSVVSREVVSESFRYDVALNKSVGEVPEVREDFVSVDIPDYEVSAVSVSGSVSVNSPNGFARIIVIDSNGDEWLVFGSDFMFIDGFASFENICEETCLFDGPKVIDSVSVELLYSSIDIEDISFQKYSDRRRDKTFSELRSDQHDVKLDLVSDHVQENSLSWVSGDTDVSKKFYRDLKKLQYDTSSLRIPYDFFFYKGGVYKIRGNGR